MKAKYLSFVLAAFLANAASSSAQQGELPTPQADVFKLYERKSSLEEIAQAQGKLIKESAWQQFKQSIGSAWNVEFDNLSKMPVRMYGTAQLPTFDGTNHEVASRSFLATHLSGFVANGNDFRFLSVNKLKKYDIVSFRQYYNDVEVLFSDYSLRITRNGKVPMATLRYYPIDNTFSTNPSISDANLQTIAQQNIAGTITNVELEGLKILPVALNDKYEPHLIREIHVVGKNAEGMPFEYVNLVDAQSGKIWSRQNKVCTMHIPSGEATKATATKAVANDQVEGVKEAPQGIMVIKGNVIFNPLQPAISKNLPFLGLTLSGTTPVYADINGNFNLTTTAPVTTTVKLQGLNAKVTKVTLSTPSQATGVVINPTDTELDLTSKFTNTELAGYYHATVMREHFRAVTNNNLSLGNVPMTVTVDETTGTCNANYNGGLNFFAAGGGCPATALFDDVVYHEYGHHINYVFGGVATTGNAHAGVQDGAIQEGYADVWAITLTDNPVLGAGFQTAATSFVRRYDQDPKVYPLDVVGEVHGDGEMIAGAWWDLRVNLNNLPLMTDLFIESNGGYREGTDLGDTFRGILLETLMADDNDGNIQNGTPNLQAIISAFARHGITLITGSALFHDPPTTQPTPYAAFPLDADFLIVDNAYLPYFGALRTTYKVDNSAWQTVPMVDVSGGTQVSFQTMVPGVPPGAIISYYIEATDTYGTLFTATPYEVNTSNSLQSNLPHYLLSGYTLRMTEDMDNQHFPGTWAVNPNGTDNATTGAWIKAAPVGSNGTGSNAYINPNVDHTAGTGNTKCYVTGNSTVGAGVGDNDVDGGVTTLVSPTLDLSSYRNPAITYWRWFANDRGGSANPGNDPLEVLISGDNGTTWQHIEMTYKDDNSWRLKAFHPSDYVGNNLSQVRLKFVASDSTRAGQTLNGGSLVEMGLDDVQVWEQTVVGTDNPTTDKVQLHIFPNPAHDFALIGLGSHANDKVSFELYNALGQRISTQTLEGIAEYRLDTRNLSSGTYVLKAIGSDWQAQERIVIER